MGLACPHARWWPSPMGISVKWNRKTGSTTRPTILALTARRLPGSGGSRPGAGRRSRAVITAETLVGGIDALYALPPPEDPTPSLRSSLRMPPSASRSTSSVVSQVSSALRSTAPSLTIVATSCRRRCQYAVPISTGRDVQSSGTCGSTSGRRCRSWDAARRAGSTRPDCGRAADRD